MRQVNAQTVPAVLGAIFSLKDLKRGPENSGKLSSYVSAVLKNPDNF